MKRNNLWLGLLAASVLTACGGSSGNNASDNTDTASGGMDGTGISQGPVTGFGSVYVNGVHFSTSSASFMRDGSSASQDDFSLGEYVTVIGTVNSDGVTGTATQVIFDDMIEAPVTAIDTTNNSLTLLGQTFTTDALTVMVGFATLADLQAGNVVEISGVQGADGNIRATAVKLKGSSSDDSPEIEVKGQVSSLDTAAQTFVLGSSAVVVDYSNVSVLPSLQNGAFVEVKSTTAYDGSTLVASRIELESGSSSYYDDGDEVEIEGLVTRYVSRSDFSVNGVVIATGSSTRFEHDGLGLALNARVKVEGSVDAQGVLQAREVEVRDSSESSELKATIEAIGSESITVLGNEVAINSGTLLQNDDGLMISLAQLRIGQYVEIRYNTLGDGSRLATRIKLDDNSDSSGSDDSGSDNEYELEGKVSSVDAATQSFLLNGVTVYVNSSTDIEFDSNSVSSALLFAQLQAGMRLEVKGVSLGNNSMTATDIELDD